MHISLRKLNFARVRKANFVGYNSSKQRVHYLCLGSPPPGENGGNTAVNTHRVLKIIQSAMREIGPCTWYRGKNRGGV